jgi:hypothetical protein
MSRYARGVTLGSNERATRPKTQPGETKVVSTHCCEVTLPNGQSSSVEYHRHGATSHEFRFGDPLNQRMWVTQRIGAGTAGIEKKAAALAPDAFRKAQEEERTAMKRSLTSAEARTRTVDGGPEMDTKAAEACAGRYAVCVSFTSGRLLRIGGLYDTPEAAAQEIASGQHRSVRLMNGQQLVVGICSRSERRWTLPKFATLPPGEPVTDPGDVPAEEESAQEPDIPDDLDTSGPD